MEPDSKRIVRQWNREIEAEMRRLAPAKRDNGGRWKLVVWTLLEAIWLVVVLAVMGLFGRLH
jgi:hypothetical protein